MKKLIITGWGPKLTLIIPANIFYLDLCDAINSFQEIKARLREIEVFNFDAHDAEQLLQNKQVDVRGDNGILEFIITDIILFELFQG